MHHQTPEKFLQTYMLLREKALRRRKCSHTRRDCFTKIFVAALRDNEKRCEKMD
jgi:hypothetical protein